jgi:hypothetical protein
MLRFCDFFLLWIVFLFCCRNLGQLCVHLKNIHDSMVMCVSGWGTGNEVFLILQRHGLGMVSVCPMLRSYGRNG